VDGFSFQVYENLGGGVKMLECLEKCGKVSPQVLLHGLVCRQFGQKVECTNLKDSQSVQCQSRESGKVDHLPCFSGEGECVHTNTQTHKHTNTQTHKT